jgi:hypothetical protein
MTHKPATYAIIRTQTAKFLYLYFSKLAPRGPASERVLKAISADLRRSLVDAGVDPDGASGVGA